VTIKKTPSETAGIKDLLTKVAVHWGERSQHRKQTFDFSNLQAKTKGFSTFLPNLLGFSRASRSAVIELELVGNNAV
jgi:hypothetical protein